MLLGKRSRPPMRRTTSLTEFSAKDLAAAEAGDEKESSPRQQQKHPYRHKEREGMPPRSMQRRSFGDFGDGAAADSAQFLMACGLCNRRLGPGLDTFIYRGEIAFCSQECRQKKMNQVELKEKRLLPLIKSDAAPSTAPSEAAGNGETVAVA